MSASGGGTGLHGVLQEATGCAMDTERDWVAQLEAQSYMVQAVPLGEAVTEELQTLAQKSNKCSWGVVLFAQDRGEPAWVVLSAGGYARSTADMPGTKWHWRKEKILDRLTDFSVTQFSSHAAKAIATCLQSKSVLDFLGGWAIACLGS